MKILNFELLTFGVIISALVAVPFISKAFSFSDFLNKSESQISNEIEVLTNTGGNIVQSEDNINEGNSESYIYINNIISGKEIDPIEIQVKSKIKADENTALVEKTVEVGNEIKTEKYEISIDGNEEKINKTNWLEKIGGGIKSFFSSIFEIFS